MTEVSQLNLSSEDPLAVHQRRMEMPFGALAYPDGKTRFQIWAPTAKSVELVVEYQGEDRRVPFEFIPHGWYSVTIEGLPVGTRYQYCIDGEWMVPDPASRCQAEEDVHGKSVVLDPTEYSWNDSGWMGRPWEEAVIYELHVGTFTPEGTFAAVIDKLDYLRDLGVTAIELLPVADFPGRYNWGYDGVLWFAPDRQYGHPHDLKRLVDEAHQRGMMVFLDVVYNHFGPEGNYLGKYAASFYNPTSKTPWGDAIDYDGPGRYGVRQFVINNALYWLHEFHLDGLRLDAVHTLVDYSEKHILYALADEVRNRIQQLESLRHPDGQSNRHIHLMLENPENKVRLIQRDSHGNPLHYNAQWNDDFHHSVHCLLTNEFHGVFSDYRQGTHPYGPVGHLARAMAEGFAYQGEVSQFYGGQPLGEPSRSLPPTAFISFLQNHDQVGNRALGERLNHLAKPEAIEAATTVWLLAPQIPMLWMGEEWLSPKPFLFFCDFRSDLHQSIREGRHNAYFQYENFRDPIALKNLPDPFSQETFDQCKLDWTLFQSEGHQEYYHHHQNLLNARHQWVVPRLKDRVFHQPAEFTVLSPGGFTVQWELANGEHWWVLANLSPVPLVLPDTLGQFQREEMANHTVVMESRPHTLSSMLEPNGDGVYTMVPWSAVWFCRENNG